MQWYAILITCVHQGYRQKDYFIATQGPLSHTVEDFWRMVWEWKCHSIVMLTELQEREQVQTISENESFFLITCFILVRVVTVRRQPGTPNTVQRPIRLLIAVCKQKSYQSRFGVLQELLQVLWFMQEGWFWLAFDCFLCMLSQV